MANATTGRWAGQRERRRAEFIDAALVVIEQHGPQTSTEQIAAHVGVSRTKLYRHFVDAADLQREVAHRTSQMITAELAPVWRPEGSMAQIVQAGVAAHVHFLIQHPNLYRYLQRCSIDEGFNAFADIKITIANLLTAVLKVYVAAFDVQADAERLSYSIVGLVETAAGHWLEQPLRDSQDALVADLTRWIWLMLDDSLRAGGVYVAADEILPPAADIAENSDRYRDPARLQALNL
ncbi:TetR/AcrR family transcriptional regulator [Mycolicibacterium llatzerense]|uniref:TetR/AcrR family transcriptional regulator n=1 Tax=Mycolicibacterium llatzerense TaxID=280871 RepID=UPI0005C6A01C|nr:TetR/AcrR family transcriptional regulator [Mycolicibacterium llatzerense]